MGVTSGTLTGSPSSGQEIKFYKSPAYGYTASATTDGTSRYLITLAAGTYKATVNGHDCLPATFNIPTGSKIQNLSYPALVHGDEDDQGEDEQCCCCGKEPKAITKFTVYKLKDGQSLPSGNPLPGHTTRYQNCYAPIEGTVDGDYPGAHGHAKKPLNALLFVFDTGVGTGDAPKPDPTKWDEWVLPTDPDFELFL